MTMIAAIIVAIIDIMRWLWLLLWLISWDDYDCYYGWYHEMTMIAALIAAMAKRSDNNDYNRAKWWLE